MSASTAVKRAKSKQSAGIELPNDIQLYCILSKGENSQAEIKIKSQDVYKYLACTPQQLKLVKCPHLASSSDGSKGYQIVIYYKGDILEKPSQIKKQQRASKSDSTPNNVNISASYVALKLITGVALIASEEKFGKAECKDITARTTMMIKKNPSQYQSLLSNTALMESLKRGMENVRANAGLEALSDKELKKMGNLKINDFNDSNKVAEAAKMLGADAILKSMGGDIAKATGASTTDIDKAINTVTGTGTGSIMGMLTPSILNQAKDILGSLMNDSKVPNPEVAAQSPVVPDVNINTLKANPSLVSLVEKMSLSSSMADNLSSVSLQPPPETKDVVGAKSNIEAVPGKSLSAPQQSVGCDDGVCTKPVAGAKPPGGCEVEETRVLSEPSIPLGDNG